MHEERQSERRGRLCSTRQQNRLQLFIPIWPHACTSTSIHVVHTMLSSLEPLLELKDLYSQTAETATNWHPLATSPFHEFPWADESWLVNDHDSPLPPISGSCGNTKFHPSSQFRTTLKGSLSFRVPYGLHRGFCSNYVMTQCFSLSRINSFLSL